MSGTRPPSRPSVARYWLAFALLVAPCLALGGWAYGAHRARTRHEQAALSVAWRQSGEDAARAALGERLARVVALARRAPRPPTDEAQGASWWRSVTDDGAIVAAFGWRDDAALTLRGAPLSAPGRPAQVDAGLAEARRLEFVAGEFAAAAAAYAQVAGRSVDPAIRAEALAGHAAASAKGGDHRRAIDGLIAALPPAQPPQVSPEAAFALARAWQRASEDPAAQQSRFDELLILIADSAERVGDDATAARALAAASPGDDAMRRDLTARLARHAAARTAAGLLGRADRDWLAETDGEAPAWRLIGDAPSVAVRRDEMVVVLRLDGARIEQDLAGALIRRPALLALAGAFAARFGVAVAGPDTAVTIAAPWDATLSIALPVATDLPLVPSAFMTEAFIAAGAALAVLGFVVLYRTAGRDLALARLRSDFVANTTHELKTPLALMRVYAEMLCLGYEKDGEERRRWHGIILRETRRLADLIEDVLHLAAVERGTRTYRRDRIDLATLAGEVLADYRPQLEATGFAIDEALAPAPVVGDRDALAQALINLVSNAAKYSRDERFIAVTTRRDGASAVLEVADRGIGIAARDQQRIFEPFYRVESGLTRETRGVGIGLSVVKSMAEAHGGQVEVDSALGAGSRFRLVLPAVDAA
ncbi:MAG TPA: HAMP domain-containing sensor histidine kinase [Planctomycetota bacterium]|nr:HAMP domain-containing sensor histidine kinase [Planctomycetota bacterium]